MDTEKLTTATEGVFWVISAKSELKYKIIYNFCQYESHSTIWKLVQKTHSELTVYDYEHFPRGRVWKNKNDATKKYTIFIPTNINTQEIVENVNNIFNLNNDFIVETYD